MLSQMGSKDEARIEVSVFGFWQGMRRSGVVVRVAVPRYLRGIERKSLSRIIFADLEERVAQIIWIQETLIVINDIGHIHKHFIKTQSLHPFIPSKAFQEFVENLGSISEPSEILPEHNDNLWTCLFSIGDQLQFTQPAAACLIVACDNDLLLLDSKWEELQCGILGFKDAGIEAVVILR